MAYWKNSMSTRPFTTASCRWLS